MASPAMMSEIKLRIPAVGFGLGAFDMKRSIKDKYKGQGGVVKVCSLRDVYAQWPTLDVTMIVKKLLAAAGDR